MKNKSAQSGQSDIQKLGELIEAIDFAMLTTVDTDGTLRSRPMSTQQVEFDGDLWFFTGADAAKVYEVNQEHQVNVSYAAPDDQRYVSISGWAELVRDRQKMEELWNPVYKAWFPDGLDDPNLALLKVHVEKAEYWDSPNGVVVQLVGFAKALVTGQRYQGGENEKISLAPLPKQG
ncbi:MAG: pyridoxamine 5'-phosphate oxidase family protein [Caldilineaceae bacterium]